MQQADPASVARLGALSKFELRQIADGLLMPEPSVLARCVEFVLAETQGLWHGRARAMMCRRLKHCELNPAQGAALVDCITRRLASGAFSEQFKDQLRLALHIDAARTRIACQACTTSTRPHIARYAGWALSPGRGAVMRSPP